MAAITAWFVARRQASGKVQTSDAITLWQSAEVLRRELREEVVRQRNQIAMLEAQLLELQTEVRRLKVRLARYADETTSGE